MEVPLIKPESNENANKSCQCGQTKIVAGRERQQIKNTTITIYVK